MKTKLKFLDRYLSLWIFLAMALGILLGTVFPGIQDLNKKLSIGTTSIPLAIGLIIMMYPPLTRVQYNSLPALLKNKKALGISLFLNWIAGPLLMFFLAIIFLRDSPDYMMGVIIIGLARCIAMVVVWNDLAGGSREYAAILIALNSIFQVFTFSFYVWIFTSVFPNWLGIKENNLMVPLKDVAMSVFIYLGIPFLLGFLSQKLGINVKGKKWFYQKFIPMISPYTLYALLFTIILMFSLKADSILSLPFDILKISVPLIFYFFLMFFFSFFINKKIGLPYDQNAAIAFTATGNNFELAIAISIAIFGIHSGQAFAGVIGPLVEVPVLIFLVKMSRILRKKVYST